MEIVLIRHGQPKITKNIWLNATQFTRWLNAYNHCKINKTAMPPNLLKQQINHHYVISSTLPRAIASATLCSGKMPDLLINQLKEMPLPQWYLPLMINAYCWIILNGLMWIIGLNGQVESFQQSRERVKLATKKLVDLAQSKENIAVFGHVIINYFIAFELIRLGWRAQFSGKKFWSTLTLTQAE